MREHAAPRANSTGYHLVGAQDDIVHRDRTARGGEVGINTAAILSRVAVENHVIQVHLACAFDVETAAPEGPRNWSGTRHWRRRWCRERFAFADRHASQSHILGRGENFEDAVVSY